MPLEYPVDDKFLERMDSELAGWSNPVERLRAALDKDELVLYCQPILALDGAERYPMGEVLVRMREEEQALLPPGEFLPVFEHYGMMPQLDRWVVSHVLQHAGRGSRLPRFTVNVSGQTLQDAEFPPFVAAALKSAGKPADTVMFEIDESDILARLEAAARFAQAIKAFGGSLLIDGFGRRSVSFMPLKMLRIDYVKVDGSVVRKILTSEVSRTKMSAILRVGEALGVQIVAECVEEQDVLARLKALGVGFAQGFGVYQPHPIDSLAAPAR